MCVEAVRVPILLEFSGVARDEYVNIELNTPGVTWSLGGAESGEVGFALNPLALGEGLPSCIESVEIAESVIAIKTGAAEKNKKNLGDSFELSAFLCVQGEVKSIEGRCTINMEAKILASFPSQLPVEWRRGPFCIAMTHEVDHIKKMKFKLRGLKPGGTVVLRLQPHSSSGRSVRWSFEAPPVFGMGLRLNVPEGGPTVGLSVDEFEITLACGKTAIAAGAGEVTLELGLELGDSSDQDQSDSPNEPDWLLLMAERDSDVAVIAQVGIQLPKYVVDSFTPFSL